MIQRKQTLWLLIAGVLLGLTLKFPMYIGTYKNIPGAVFPFKEGVGYSMNVIIQIIGCIAAIFLYHSRKLQKIIVATTFLYCLLIMYFNYNTIISDFTTGSLTLWSIFYFAPPVFLVMAFIGIYKDEKLIKSVDRLR